MSTRQPTPEELATLEAELAKLRVEDVLLENVVGMLNLGFRRSGFAGGTEAERDPVQVQLAIDAVTALVALIERSIPPAQLTSLRDAISQLQLAYVRMNGGAEPGSAAAGASESAAAVPAQGPGPPATSQSQGPGASPAGAPGAPPSRAPGAQPPGAKPAGPEEGGGEEPGPAQRSGRLWVPGQ
jgi:hypothetical protein